MNCFKFAVILLCTVTSCYSMKEDSAIALAEGYRLLIGTPEQPPDLKRAYGHFERAATLGNTIAMVESGRMLFSGRGCHKDLEKSTSWFRRAAELKSADGEYYFAYALMNGLGVKKDTMGALVLYEKAAQKGHVQAAFRAARGYYYLGARNPEVLRRALDHYALAVSLGDYDAMIALGDLYVIGSAVPRDLSKAHKLYEDARKIEKDSSGIAAERLTKFAELTSVLYDDHYPKPD